MAKRRRQIASGLDGKFRSLTTKVEAWTRQREELAADIRGLITSAGQLLKDLDGGKITPPAVVKSPKPKQPRRRRKLSKQGRAKLVASMKKRWAEAKKAGKSKL